MAKAWFDASPEAREVFATADRVLGSRLGLPLSELCFNGPADRLNQTDASQPAIFTASIASYRAMLAANGGSLPLAAAAGLSLGEYTALCVAGSLSFEEGLELVTLRGRAMQDACDTPAAAAGGGGTMVALIGATDAQAEEIAEKARENDVLVAANYNAPGQVVLSGHKVACERAVKVAETMSLRATMLTVAGAFHSPLMAPAAEKLKAALAKASIKAPTCTVVANVTALPHDATPDSIRQRLFEQLTSPVRWSQSCVWMAANVTGTYQELAPGKTLMGLMRRIDKSVKVNTNDAPPAPAATPA